MVATKTIIKQSRIYLLVLLVSLSSCGAFNKVVKSLKKNKEKTEVVVTKEDNTVIEDKSKIVVEEKVDTTVYTKPVIKNTETLGINNLSDINNLILLSDDLIEIRQTYDTLNKILKTNVNLKPRAIDLTINKKTTTNKDTKTEIVSKRDSLYKNNNKTKDQIKEKEPKNIFWYVILGLGSLCTVYFISKKFL